MKKTILSAFFIAIALFTNAQNSLVEKNITGAQIGFFGLDLYNETRLAEKVSLRSELSLFPVIWGGDMFTKTGFAFYPAITLQPKYYFNIAKSAEAGRSTKNNSANYFGFQIRYISNWFVISNDIENLNLTNQLNLIPTFGIRRNFSGNFNYEFKTGLGYGTTIGYHKNVSRVVLDLSFKIGYDF